MSWSVDIKSRFMSFILIGLRFEAFLFNELQLLIVVVTNSENPELSSLRRMLKEMKSILIFHSIWQVRHGI
jgi:hypothetical protein